MCFPLFRNRIAVKTSEQQQERDELRILPTDDKKTVNMKKKKLYKLEKEKEAKAEAKAERKAAREEAKAAGAAVIGTGRSDFPNQINNVLAFPGIFRGALDVRASDINDEMKVAAAYAIANIITDEERNAEYIIPNPFDKRVAKAVAEAVAKAARDTGVARI